MTVYRFPEITQQGYLKIKQIMRIQVFKPIFRKISEDFPEGIARRRKNTERVSQGIYDDFFKKPLKKKTLKNYQDSKESFLKSPLEKN